MDLPTQCWKVGNEIITLVLDGPHTERSKPFHTMSSEIGLFVYVDIWELRSVLYLERFFPIWYVHVSLLLQLCLTLCDPMDYSLPGSSVHGILQVRILEWVALPSSRGSKQSLLCLLHWQVGSLSLQPPGMPSLYDGSPQFNSAPRSTLRTPLINLLVGSATVDFIIWAALLQGSSLGLTNSMHSPYSSTFNNAFLALAVSSTSASQLLLHSCTSH